MLISKLVDYVKNEISFSKKFYEDNVFVTLRIEPILKILENLEQSHKDILEYVKEIEKKDKIIDLMEKYIADIDNEDICCEIENKHCNKNMDYDECEDCIKQYFERKATNDG